MLLFVNIERGNAKEIVRYFELLKEKYSTLVIPFDKVLADKLNVMDATAIVMCRDNNLPLRVFNLFNAGDLLRIVDGEDVGTLVANS
jgi:uridylate kinase